MKIIFIILILITNLNSIFSQESTFDFARSLPNPRPQFSSWILDQTKILEAAGNKESINQMIELLEKDTTNEIAIVILPTIGKLVPKNLATELFQTWGIGKLGKDNGVLILHVLDQRRIEIETGYGLEGILTDVICKRLLEEKTIPYFKVGAFSIGHENLILTINQILRDKKNSPTVTLSSYQSNLPTPEKVNADIIPEEMKIFLDPELNSKKEWRIYSIISLFSGILLLYFYRLFLYKTASYWKTKYENISDRKDALTSLAVFAYTLPILLITAGIAGLSYFFTGIEYITFAICVPGILSIGLIGYFLPRMYKKWENFLLTAPRRCSKCKSDSILIEDNNDVYRLLTEEERFEQKFRIFIFSLYECTKCNHIDKFKAKGIHFGNFKRCSKCESISAMETFKTLSDATEFEEGLEEITLTCRKCGFTSSKNSKTPKLTKYSANPNPKSTTSNLSVSESKTNSNTNKDFGGGASGGGGAGSSY